MRLKDKIAVITGGTSGMGRAAAELFAKEGAKVVVAARRKRLGEYVAESIRNGGGTAIFVKADVSEKHQVMDLIDEASDTFGGLNILFNNAGIDIRRVVESEEIANLVTFLASEKASAITGESIAAGGGAGTAVFS